ncbi:MAG TPA: Lrp/AsnC family transcriptional regulator [candidate division Zixibacteria bacterium]|nr:Lrp/AsnC family transcriptional regulator [candidate division Zixibacteria bacterium]
MTIDGKDKLILDELTKDARIPTKRIAANLDIPRVTVHTRIEKMKQDGVIQQFTVVTDYKKIGLPVLAFVFVSFTPYEKLTQQELAETIAKIDNVYEVHLISGEWDILVKIRGESLDQIGMIVLEKIRMLDGVAKTITCPSFSSIKNGF